jgi:rare lipoprotein A
MKAIIISLLLALPCFSEEIGIASHYSTKSGNKTASGEKLNDNKLTAAHKTLPFGTIVKVTNISNGKTVNVRINDDGPHVKGRIIDLSQAAAKELGIIERGISKVKIEIIKLGEGKFRR